MLLMVEKGITERIYPSIYQYAEANNKYMKDYDKNKESSYTQYWDVNNFYGLAMSQKLPDTSQFNKAFVKSQNKENHKGYFLEVDVQYPENLHNLHTDLPFLSGSMKIEKVEKLVAHLNDKTECYTLKKLNTGIKS